MKIGRKISLFYSIVTFCIIVIVIGIFYLFSVQYINNLYQSYLQEKAFLTAQKHWEKDEVDEQKYLVIQEKYNELLPQAQELLLNVDSLNTTNDILNQYLNDKQKNELLQGSEKYLSFKYKDRIGAALYYPDNEGNFIVLILSDNAYGKKIQHHLLALSIVLILISSILIFFIGNFYSNHILTPLQHILKQLKLIRSDNLNTRFKESGNKDELDELVRTLNAMLDNIDMALKSEKSFVSTASHELNNPITAIQGECEITLMKERQTADYIQSLQRISTESKRISELIKSLLFLSRQDKDILSNTIEEIDLQKLLKEKYASNKRIKLQLSNENKFTVKANPYLLCIAIDNIINNACKYSNGDVKICLSNTNDTKEIEITDYGIGIPEDEIELICQSFYRADNTRDFKGQGIGLSLSNKIIKIYGGKMIINSKINQYTTVKIVFS